VLGKIALDRVEATQAKSAIWPEHSEGARGPSSTGGVDNPSIAVHIGFRGRDFIAPLNSRKNTKNEIAPIGIERFSGVMPKTLCAKDLPKLIPGLHMQLLTSVEAAKLFSRLGAVLRVGAPKCPIKIGGHCWRDSNQESPGKILDLNVG